MGIVWLTGVTVMDLMVALVTLNGTDALTEPRVAVMVTPPGCNPDNWLTEINLATVVSEEDQVTREVRLFVLPLLKWPVAVIAVLVPWAMLLATWIVIELRLLASTVSGLLALTDSNAAEIFVVPMFLAVTRPLTVTVATEVDPELQVDTLVTSCVVPSEKFAVAVNC